MQKKRVLVLLGWHDVRVLGALARHACAAGWQLETRHFFDETLPVGWSGDGMLISNTARPNALRFMAEQAPHQPTVLIDRNRPAVEVAAHVHEDNFAIGHLAAEHLLALGHKHFVWWTSAQGTVPDERLAGFREALAREGCDCKRLEYRPSPEKGEWLRRREWLSSHLRDLPRPVALFAMDDQLAAEAVEMCLECGLEVPRDVAVVGVGNIELASQTSHVPITSVDHAPEEVALAGARLLDYLMAGGTAPDSPVVVPPHGLIARESSAQLAVTHPTVIQAIECLRAGLSSPFDIHGVAKVTRVSARTLYNLFRSELRCTPVDFVQREQLARAKSMLQDGETSIKELVDSCGFGTARTMNRLFLRYEGCSPKVWRQQMRAGKP